MSSMNSPSAGIAPIDPFRSLHVHFGMLLGVEDFRTVDAYHRGKAWYHGGWLHGPGVIWGFGPSLDRAPAPEGADEPGPLTGELRVSAGAALDARGRELALHQDLCLSIPAWYAENENAAELAAHRSIDDATGEVTFVAHVLLEFDACLDRQVPALSEPCDGGSATTAYSRVVERPRLALVPGPAPEQRGVAPGRYHRLRLLFGLDAPEEAEDAPGAPTDADQAVLDARAEVAALPEAERPARRLHWARRFAVLDGIDLAPEQGGGEVWNILPKLPPAPVVLAELRDARLSADDDGRTLLSAELDPFVRPTLLPSSTIQELLAGCCAAPPAAGDEAPAFDPATVALDGDEIALNVVNGPLAASTVVPGAFSVTIFDADAGWTETAVDAAAHDPDAGTVTLTLADPPGDGLVRLIARGSGQTPLMGANGLPLAGAAGGPAAPHGSDFVHHISGEN